MASPRRALTAALSIATVYLGLACNLIIGAHERTLDSDAGARPDSSAPPEDADPPEEDTGSTVRPTDAGREADAADAAPIVVRGPWGTPNLATFEELDGGVKITAYDPTATHPIVAPSPQPPIPSDDYTVRGTVHAPTNSEFGILARVQVNGAAMLLSSRFGGRNYPWLGKIEPPSWNPAPLGTGEDYTFVPGARYRFTMKVAGTQVLGKIWEAGSVEPDFQVSAISPWATGRGVGYYTYFAPADVALESLEVTVP
jgi:hypothetical protein